MNGLEAVRLSLFITWERVESNHQVFITQLIYSQLASPSCRTPENKKTAEGFSQGGSRSFRLFSLVYESGAFPS